MTEEWNGSVGERLLKLRNEKGMTQEDLAEYLYVSRQSVSKWELNKTLPDVEKLMQLSELYGVSLDYLVKGVENSVESVEETDITLSEKSGKGEGVDADKTGTIIETEAFRIVFLLAMIACAILCICAFTFSIRLMGHHTFTLDGKQQDYTSVDKIYEQYTLADVTIWDNESNYYNKKVWIDIPGVREGDYIGYFYEDAEEDELLLEYYDKTLIVPLIVSILLLIFTIIFGIGFWSCSVEKEKRRGEKE